MNIHDRNAVKVYARLVSWRGAWMTSVAAVVGLFAVIGTVGTVFVWTRVFGPITREVREEFSFNDPQMDVGFETIELIRLIVGHDWFIVTFSALLFAVPIINSRWNYLRYKAEAQATVALSEIADGPRQFDMRAATPTGSTRLVFGCTWTLPVFFTLAISIAILTIVWTPKSLHVDLKSVEGSDLIVFKFDKRLFKFQSIYVELRNEGNDTALSSFSLRPYHPDFIGFCLGNTLVLRNSDEEEIVIIEPQLPDLGNDELSSEQSERGVEAPIVVENDETHTLEEFLTNPDLGSVSAEISWTTAYGSSGASMSKLSLETLPRAPGNALDEGCLGF